MPPLPSRLTSVSIDIRFISPLLTESWPPAVSLDGHFPSLIQQRYFFQPLADSQGSGGLLPYYLTMELGNMMLLEFYRSGPAAPAAYDIRMGLDGSLVYKDECAAKDTLRVVVETRHNRTSVFQANAIFSLIYRQQLCTVVFYDFAQ